MICRAFPLTLGPLNQEHHRAYFSTFQSLKKAAYWSHKLKDKGDSMMTDENLVGFLNYTQQETTHHNADSPFFKEGYHNL